jgi:hypothetical protein
MKFVTVTLLVTSVLVCPIVSFLSGSSTEFRWQRFRTHRASPSSFRHRRRVVTWYDNRATYDIYAQRVNTLGAAQWTAGGVALCSFAGDQLIRPRTDRAGQLWCGGLRNGGADDLYAQRINASGAVQWAAGIIICNAASNQTYPPSSRMERVHRSVAGPSAATGIYMQRVNAPGVAQDGERSAGRLRPI